MTIEQIDCPCCGLVSWMAYDEHEDVEALRCCYCRKAWWLCPDPEFFGPDATPEDNATETAETPERALAIHPLYP